MTVRSANDFPGAEHQPLAYPGLRPDFSYVYYRGKVYEITCPDDTKADLWLYDSTGRVTLDGKVYEITCPDDTNADQRPDDSTGRVTLDAFLESRGNATLGQRHAVLAVGSNGCPGRLGEKYAQQPEVALPVFVGTLINTAVVYSRQLAPYGALPATYLYQPGAVSRLSVTMLTDEQLALMDETEAVGQYLRIRVPGYFRVKDGPVIGDLTAYLDRKILTWKGKPVRLKMFAPEAPDGPIDWPNMDERDVLALVFDQANLLSGETVETRHRQLLTDTALREQLEEFLDTRMSALMVDSEGELVERAQPYIKCTRVMRTGDRPGSEGTYIVRLSKANSRRLKVGNRAYLRVRYGNASVMARLSVEGSLDKEEIRIDQTLRTAIGLEPIMQGSKKEEFIYCPGRDGDLKYPIDIQRTKLGGWNPLTRLLRRVPARLLKQQYLICVVHHAMGTDMETPIVRLRTRAMEVLGIQPGDKVFLISEGGHKALRCLSLDPTFEPPSDTMKTAFADRQCPPPDDEGLRLPWITMDLQTRRALKVQPWQPVIVGRDLYHALASEFSQVAMAVALAALGGAIVIQYVPGQLAILAGGLLIISMLIGAKIRSRI